MPMDDVAGLGVVELAAAIARGELSAVEAVDGALVRLAGEGTALACIAGIDADDARAAAEAADRVPRPARGSLHGVPLAHKDMFFRAGRATECGSRLMAGYRASSTATALCRLDAAGAVDVARLSMSEFAIGPTGHNPVTGTPRNPWNPDHLAGGTSSGPAVAVAAGLVPAALGSDTGGSVRLPAAFCGVVGLKPGYGRVSRAGMFPCSATLDHVGVLARGVADCALVLSAIAGADSLDPTASHRPPPPATVAPASLEGVRIGVPRSYFLEALDGDAERVADAALDTFRRLGARLVPVDVPRAELGNPLASLIIMVEAATVHRRWMVERANDYAPETLARLRTGPLYAATDYRLALTARAAMLKEIGAAVFTEVDILFTPAATGPAPRIDGGDLPAGTGFADLVGPVGRCLRLFNVIGLPALVLPAGLAANGLPLGIQLVGRPFGEADILHAGLAFETAVGGFPRPPRIVRQDSAAS